MKKFKVKRSELRKEIETVLNKYSAENGSNTPDFILADYVMDCLDAYDKSVMSREKWYGRVDVPVPEPIGDSLVGRDYNLELQTWDY